MKIVLSLIVLLLPSVVHSCTPSYCSWPPLSNNRHSERKDQAKIYSPSHVPEAGLTIFEIIEALGEVKEDPSLGEQALKAWRNNLLDSNDSIKDKEIRNLLIDYKLLCRKTETVPPYIYDVLESHNCLNPLNN